MTTEEVTKEFENIIYRHGFLKSDLEDFFHAASEIIDWMADQTEEHEPYAKITIDKYREVARTMYDAETAAEDYTYEDSTDESNDLDEK